MGQPRLYVPFRFVLVHPSLLVVASSSLIINPDPHGSDSEAISASLCWAFPKAALRGKVRVLKGALENGTSALNAFDRLRNVQQNSLASISSVLGLFCR